jgi:hypothetical protein
LIFKSLFCKHIYSMEGLFTSPESEQVGQAVLVLCCVKCEKILSFRVLMNKAKVKPVEKNAN